MAVDSKDELLLDLIEEWWGCIRESELEESLDDLDPEDVKKYYDSAGDGGDDDDNDVVSQIKNDVETLFTKIREILGDA